MQYLTLFFFVLVLSLCCALALVTIETGNLRRDLREAETRADEGWQQVQILRASISSGIKIKL
jgi:hypothetical protein